MQKHAELLTFDSMPEFTPTSSHNKFSSSRLLQMLVDVGAIRNKRKYDADIVSNLCDCILSCWAEHYGEDIFNVETNGRERNDVNRAINYIVYKTIKISTVYSQYRRFSSIYNTGVYRNVIKEYVNRLFEDETHVTLKLRKALAYLQFRHYGTNMGLREDGAIKQELTIENFATKIEEIKENQRHEINIDGHEPSHIWKEEELLPAPCFKTDILMKEPNIPKNAYLRYSMMSSGEKQIINAMCTFVYHIYNLDSVFNTGEGERLKYKNVNMIFDELELYFHPKYQAMLVDSILKTIAGMNLHNIKNINIIMSTHSPFILSDIPACNTMKIKKGKCDTMKENNFCANVYDILNSHFFMDEFIGKFAKEKLDYIFEEVNDLCKNEDVDIEKVKRDIMLVGDDVIRISLLEKIGEKYEMVKIETELEKMRQKMQELEDELRQERQ